MPHLNLPDALPGIRGLMAFRPETAKPLNELVEALLWNRNSLTPGERELIATYLSAKNDCYYRARANGATDTEIHDTVLIAAAFCMFNRYVDGLATWAPEDADFCRGRGEIVARNGYVTVNKHLGSEAQSAKVSIR